MKRTELDDWARDWMNTQLFNLTIMGGDFPGVEVIYRAGFERAVKEVLSRVNNDQATYEAIEAIGQGQARDDQKAD